MSGSEYKNIDNKPKNAPPKIKGAEPEIISKHTPILEIKDLTITFKNTDGGDDLHAVQDASFTLFKEQTLAIVGESGSGKTVTAYSILRLLAGNGHIAEYTSIDFLGQSLLKKSKKEMRAIRGKKIGMIFQEPLTALNPLHTIEQQIGETLRLHFKYNDQKTHKRVLELLDLVGFPEAKSRLNDYPHQLSGGQRQRVMIAMALACEPELLIADEPTTALDVTIQEGIIQLLSDLKKRLKMSILLISHDLNMVKKMADYVVVMNKGKVVEQNSTKNIFEAPRDDYTKHLIDSEPKGKPKPVDPHAPIILQAENMNVQFGAAPSIFAKFYEKLTGIQYWPDPKVAVNGVSIDLKRGETLGVVGESGSGKSTLIFSILKLLPIEQGNVVVLGRNITDINNRDLCDLRAEFQVVFQDPFGALNPRMTVMDILAEGLCVHEASLKSDQIHQRVIGVLHDIGLDKSALHRYPHEFSGGQRQRISIGRCLILKPKIIALDEPTSALDRSIQAEIIELLRNLQAKYDLSYLFISHDLSVVRAMCHRMIVMRHGKIVESGDVESLITNPQTDYTKKLIESAFS